MYKKMIMYGTGCYSHELIYDSKILVSINTGFNAVMIENKHLKFVFGDNGKIMKLWI